MNKPKLYSLPNIPCEILYFDEEDGIYIDVIKTEEEHRGNGYARLIMESFIKDMPTDKDITLIACGLLGSDTARLVKFYDSLGFVTYNVCSIGCDMILEGTDCE